MTIIIILLFVVVAIARSKIKNKFIDKMAENLGDPKTIVYVLLYNTMNIAMFFWLIYCAYILIKH